MIAFALCNDRPGSSGVRAELFETHAAHIVRSVPRLMLAAPFGPVDGVDPLATEGLSGSIFAIEARDLTEAAALMRDDPYSDTVWGQVELLAATDLAGRWTKPGHEAAGGITSGDGRYLLLSRAPSPRGAVSGPALLAADVEHGLMIVGDKRSDCRGILVVEAPDIAAAAALGRALHGGRDVADAMAIPVGMGRWPGYPQLAPA